MSQILLQGTFLALEVKKKVQVLAFFFFNCEKKLDGKGLEFETNL